MPCPNRAAALQFLLPVFVILSFAPGDQMHPEYGNRGDQNDVNVTAFVQHQRQNYPHSRQRGAYFPHIF
jgi:hypothetical protein